MKDKENKNKICEIMGLVSISKKNKIKKAPLPKISLLVQFGEEIYATLCSDVSIVNVMIWANVRRICAESSEQTGAHILTNLH